jgi:hypothetical protein
MDRRMSNYPQSGYPPGPGYPQDGYPPQRSGCGCGGCLGKFLILMGVIFLLLIGMCCGVVFYLRSYFASSVSQQPAEVRAISDEIISIRIPPPLEPAGGGRFKVPFSDTTLGEGAFYADKDRKGFLMLVAFGDAFGPQIKDTVIHDFESGQNRKQPGGNEDDNNEELKDPKTTRLEPTIHGEKARFEITEGTGARTGKKKIRVQGAFLGKTGPAILVLNAEAETFSLEKIKEMIGSME